MVGTPGHSKAAVGSRKQNTLLIDFSLWPNSSNEAPLSKVSTPPNVKLCCEYHLYTPWIRWESFWSNLFHGVPVHLEEDLNQWWGFREHFRNKLKQKQWGPIKQNLRVAREWHLNSVWRKSRSHQTKMAEKKRRRPSKDAGVTESRQLFIIFKWKKLRIYAERNYPFQIRKDGDISRDQINKNFPSHWVLALISEQRSCLHLIIVTCSSSDKGSGINS